MSASNRSVEARLDRRICRPPARARRAGPRSPRDRRRAASAAAAARLRHALRAALARSQRVVGIRADREHDDHRGVVARRESREQRQQRFALRRALGAKQLLGLVDGDDDRRRPRALAARRAPPGCRGRARRAGPQRRRARAPPRAVGARAWPAPPRRARRAACSPVSAARSGRIGGRARNALSSRASRGRSPARRNDDLPAPEAPRMTNRRGGAAAPQARAAGRAPRRSARRGRRRAGVLRLQRLRPR